MRKLLKKKIVVIQRFTNLNCSRLFNWLFDFPFSFFSKNFNWPKLEMNVYFQNFYNSQMFLVLIHFSKNIGVFEHFASIKFTNNLTIKPLFVTISEQERQNSTFRVWSRCQNVNNSGKKEIKFVFLIENAKWKASLPVLHSKFPILKF